MTSPRRTTGARRRRVVDAGLLALAAVVVVVATFLVALASGGERVARLWVAATVAEDGSARVVEVIDYDFGIEERHGIFRYAPGLRTTAPVEVSSPDAPDDVEIGTGAAPRIRIGDPAVTVSGRHRYVLSYTLDGVAPGGRLAWDAVGTGWEVPIDDVEVHVTGPTELTAGGCVTGSAGSTDPCPLEEVEPGHLLARVDGLDGGEGVTVTATAGADLARTPALPEPPAAAPPPPGIDPLVPAALAGALFLLAAAVVSRLVRRAGREHVPSVGIPVTTAPGEEARIDFEDLGGYATPSPSLPGTLSPAEGGVLLTGGVLAHHKAAWLIDQAVAGTVELESAAGARRTEITMVRLGPGDPAARRVLDLAFRGRDRVELGGYDEDFAAAWKAIGEELTGWQRTCGLWDAAADHRARRVRVAGTLTAVLGAALAVLGGWLSAGQVGLPLVLAGIGGALAGAGLAAAIRGWELRVLTPDGSATWLRVESLRQFFASSPPTAVDEAIAAGQVGRYTAWAVALGEAERWSQLASRTSVSHGSPMAVHHLRYATFGPVFVAGCSTASTAPSSSGGGGGGVGGGAGGGGGGSW